MHLIVPFAGVLSEAGRQAIHSLALPHLERLLAHLAPATDAAPVTVDQPDESSLSTPHERELARQRGWPVADGALPWAALAARSAGLDAAGGEPRAWALLTPVHLEAGADRVTLRHPKALSLDDEVSRTLLEAVAPLFDDGGIRLHWLAADRWLAVHPMFDGLATASLDRVIGRDISHWVPRQAQARPWRRLQNEVQMVLHRHAVNLAREDAGLWPVNSLWCSSCGRLPPTDREPQGVLDDRLRDPALAEDWVAWCEAWQSLDAGPIAQALSRPSEAMLTLCGERRAVHLAARPQGLWHRLGARWRRIAPQPLLESL